MTRVGLLECDHVAADRRAVAGDYRDMFAALFAAHAPGLDLVPVDVVGGEPLPDPRACDGWVCTGSRHSVLDDLDWVRALAGFVRSAHAAAVPFAGICFGHQMVAHALGGRVERAATGWGVGVHPVTIERPAPWMDPPADRVALHFMHQDQVVALPPGGRVLGRAPHCPVAVLEVGEAMVGVQAHPEFTPAYTEALLADRVARIGDAEVAAARASLAQPTDEAVVARWLARVVGPAAASPPVG